MRFEKPLFDPERYKAEMQNEMIKKIKASNMKQKNEDERHNREDIDIAKN